MITWCDSTPRTASWKPQPIASRVERQVIARLGMEPPRRHHPGIFVVEVALLRSRDGRLVPRVALIDWIAERVLLHERLLLLPVVVIRTAEQNPDPEIDVDEV